MRQLSITGSNKLCAGLDSRDIEEKREEMSRGVESTGVQWTSLEFSVIEAFTADRNMTELFAQDPLTRNDSEAHIHTDALEKEANKYSKGDG